MPQTFYTEFKDTTHRRIVIPKDRLEKEKIEKGDTIKVTIEKVSS